MADVKTNQSKVYNALKGMGFSGIGNSEADFAAKMSNPKNREKVYNALSSKGYKGIGKDLAAFDSLIYQAPVQTDAQPQSTKQVQEPVQFQNSLQQRMYPNGQIPTKPVMQSAATQSQPTEKKQPHQVEQVQQKPSGPYKPTDMERMAFGANMGGIQYTIDNTTKGIDQIEQSAKKASPFGSGNVGLGNNGNLRKGKQTFDAEKGAFVDTYLTSDGREFRDVQQANNVQTELDNNADVIRYNNAMKALGMGDISEEKDKPIEQRLKEAYAERMELQRQLSEIAKRETSSRKGPRFPSMVGGSAETYSMSDESKNLSSALRLLERRITALEAERDDKGQSMFWRGTADTLKDPSAYSLGLTDLADTGVMSQLKSKLDAVNGDVSQLSDTEKTLVRNYMMNQEAQRLNENRGNMYGFGQMFGQSLPFMAEFYLTGGFMGIGSAGTRLGAKAGLKMAGSELGKQMTKNLGGRILLKTGQSLLKGTGRVGGALVGGALQSNTIGAAKTYSDIANRNMGNLTIDDKGNLDFSDGEGIAEAFLKGQLTNAFENGSELLGPAFDFAPNYLARVIKNKVAGGAINKMLSNKVWRGTNKFLRKLGVQGLFGEGMEEEANNIGNVLIGESNWFKDPNDPNKPAFFDGEEQFKTWAGVALTGAILRGPALAVGGYQKAQYYANKYNLNSSANQMHSVLGDYDRYQNIKAMLDGATNENIGSVLNSIVRGGQLNNQEKEAVVMYAQDLVNLRGFNIGSVVAEAVGATPKPQVANYNIRGLHVDEVDKDGNVLASHDYENPDELKAGLYELQQQRFDDNLQSDISIMKTRPSEQYEQLVIDYLSQANPGMELSEFEAILAKPSLERTEEEQQLVAPFADLLHNTVYDNTMLHEEQSQQDGEEIADADSIDIEAPSEDGMNLNTQWMNAQANRNNLFTQDENLKQEVELMESQGLSHQEIISRLDWASPEQVQGMIDYYNTKAKYEAYINRKAQKIDEAASNARQRHTMKGTIDGVADLNNVHTITDGTNKYYLVSGDITTDPATGRITGSNSGLIIGMDENGDFVQVSDADGYSVLPVSMTLDQWEEAERTRLQEQVTQVIDPNQTMNQQLNQPQPTGEQAGAQAGASTGTGAYEAPAAPLSSEYQQPQQPAVAIQDVADKDGIKRYEQGIPVDDAIADIQNDGFDVNEIADASIAEAQQAIDKIDKKATKTRKDLMDKKSQQSTIDYYNNVKARWTEMNAEAQPAESEENVNVQPEQPIVEEKPVSSQQNLTVEEQKQQRIAEAKAKYGELFDDDFTKANDVYELASMWVGRKRNLAWDDVNGKRGLQKELGWTRKIGGDTKYIETLLAKKGEGVGVDEFVHMVWESPENDVNGEKRYSTEEIKEALLELLKSARSKSDVVDHALNTRINAAEAAMQEQQKRDEDETQELQPLEPLTVEQLADIENNLPFAQSTDEEIENAPINQLRREIDTLMQEEGMPPIQLVDTERITNDEWVEFLSDMQGYFLSQEEVEECIDIILNDGVYYNPETGSIVVFSGDQIPEEVRAKVEQIKEELSNGRSTEEENGGLETEVIQQPSAGNAQEDSAESEGETGSTSTASQGSTEPIVDDYLQPRNAEEEAIIQGVINQLQQEIQAAIDEENKARADLEKARTKESDRATDMFANDETFSEPDAIFSQEEMGLDTSAEGIDRRTAAQRDRLQEAVNKKNQLQSEQERNSRVRGALDNHRRQTKIDTDNPIEAIEQAAQSFAQEQQETINKRKERWQGKKEPAYGANNKLVTTERYEELKKRMIQKLGGQLNSGFDPELISIGAEMAMYHIEAGARKFADYATRMINDLGDAIRPYLQSFYEAARRMPDMEQLRKEMDTTDFVDSFDVLNYDKQGDNTVNEHKTENNEPKNVVSSQQEASVEVERKPEDADKYRAFSQAVANDMLNAMETGEPPYKNIKSIRAKAKSVGLEVDDEGRTDILLQELVEDGLVSAARQYMNTYMVQQMLAGKKAEEARTSRDLFNDIVKLYYLQPTISQRSSNRIKMQQYSTPLPMSFVADVFATPNKNDGTVLEPTAGNGMMVFAVPEYMVHANELDKTRLDNLRAQKFQKVTDQDATQPFEGNEQYDAIIANPPFGAAPAKDYDGKEIRGLDEQIALNALSKMKDDGKAAIIIGGNMEYAPNGAIKSDKAFFTYLYDHYNVKGVIDMDGKLYSRQGTTYPTRMILIDGRRSEEERAQSKVYPPTLEKRIGYKVNSFAELYDLAEQIRNNNNKTDGTEILRTQESGGLLDHSNASGNIDRSGRSGQSRQNDGNGRNGRTREVERRGSNPSNKGNETRGISKSSEGSMDLFGGLGLPEISKQPSTSNRREAGSDSGSVAGREPGISNTAGGNQHNVGDSGRVQSERTGNVQDRRQRDERVEEKRELSSDKLPYRPHNTAFSLESVAPAAMVEAMDSTLKSIEKEYGNIDDFVTKELGYDSVEDMHNALAAEQVDSVAMAIWNMKNGEGMIIGDQTGVGKGRQMASLIRWAVKQGKKPIFVTKDADLFSDIYRDLVDIGSGELKPFIFNANVTITDANGVVVHKSLSDAAQKKVLSMNELPDGFDFAILSYPQMNTGDSISQEESGKAAKDRGEWGAKKSKAVKSGRKTPKADFLRRIAKDNYLLMDESQNAAGSGNTGAYFQSILKDAKAVTFASATFAKRPDTMPLYAVRTAISKAKVKTWELLQMIGKGGVTLQEIMSRAMTQAGQMVRRERDMSDVKTDWKTVDDPATVKRARENYDNVMQAFNAIIDFQENYIKPALAAKSIEFAEMASSVDSRRGTEKAGIDNPPFVNRLYNFSKQLLLSLKVDAVVDEVAKEIEAGRHPVVALENTLESALDEYSVGDVIEDPTLFGKLKKGLDATFRYTIKDEDGNESGGELQPYELGSEGEKAYYDLVDLIKESTQGMFVSPLDAITEKLEEKGYRVGEISGRKTRAVLNDKGQYVVRKRENTERKKLARDFNRGDVDVLIINKTGSTGISLHASKKFSDQRQRTMIMAQPLSDINDYMQMIGRIDRTGQVHRGYYINLGLPVPAETRFMMMLANKLKSLNANTTTSQENKDNDVDAPDLLNKYGDQVMIEYLRDNPDVYRKLGEFLKDKSERGANGVSAARLDEYQPKEGDAKQITGRVALLSVDEQDAFYDDVTRRYNELIKYLNDTGSNDLKISVLPLNARTIDREVSSEGTAPNSGNPFADNAYVEWVDMDILKKPMKAAEIGKVIEQLNPEVEAPKVQAKTAAQERLLNDKLTPRVRQILDTVERETQAKMDKENERYDAAKKRAEEDIAAKAETINKQQKRTEEQKKEAIDKFASERRQSVEESHQNMVNKIDANHERLMKYLKMFKVGDSVLVPDDLETDAFLGSSNGIFCGFKTKDEGVTPSTTLAVFATLDGRRKIEVKLSDWGALQRINNMTEQNWDAAHEVTLSNWDEKIPSSSRKKGYIMTGNILQAISDTNFQGRLVTFTDDKGNVRDGVLMPDKWEPTQLKGSTVPISARKERIINMPMKESVKSSDGRVTITRHFGGYSLEVPKSKKQGGEFYLDKTLLSLVIDGDFFTHHGQMRGNVRNDNIEAVLDRLGEMSVTLPSDRKVEFKNPEESDSPKRMITTSDPMRAIEQAADSWRSEKGRSLLRQIADFVSDIPTRFGLKGAAPTYVVNSREDLESLKDIVSKEVFDEIEELYNEPDTGSAYLPKGDIVVIFGEHLDSVDEAEEAWWHEQVHAFWGRMPNDARDRIGQACYEWLRANRPDIYMHIRTEYKDSERLEESCAFFIGNVIVSRIGTERLLNNNLENSEEIRTFANKLTNHLQNGREEKRSYQPGRAGESGQTSTTQVRRGISQEREGRDNSSRPETESELQEVTDPIRAIERSAKRWKRERNDAIAGEDTPEKHSAKAVYNDRLNRIETVFSEAYQDAMVSLKTAQNAIAKDQEIPDSQNAYMAENLMHGKNKNEQDLFNRMFRDPLIHTINKILNLTGMNWGDVDRYVYTKSGLERNREFFVRDWLESERNKRIDKYEDLNPEEQDIYDGMAATIEDMFEDGDIETEEQKEKELAKALQKAHQEYVDSIEERWIALKQRNYLDLQIGDIDFADYLAGLTNFILDNIDGEYNPSEHDYSGFRAMYGNEDGKYDEDAIIDELMDTEDAIEAENVDTLWEQINAATRYGLERYREAGMRSDEQIDRVEQMFHFYVPMRGFKENMGEDMYQYFTGKDKSKSYIGGLLKHAKGRGSEAQFPISTIFSMSYKAIADCNQNMVNQKFYRLCQANPNDLVVLSDSWAVYNEITGEWEESTPDIPEDATEDEVREITLAWEEQMQQLASEDKAKKIKGKAEFDYKPMDKKKQSEHIVDVRINGQPKKMIVTSNPRMAQALNGQLRFEHGKNVFSRWNAAIKNMMATFFTSYSPTFALRNMFRDWTHFRTMLGVREGRGYASQANKYYRQSLFKMIGLFKKYRNGTLDESKEMERDFKDFMDNGGITGFVFMQKIDDIQKDMEKLYKQQKQGKAIRLNNNLWEKILGAVEALNEGIENNARFATYRASRHYAGRTKARSAYDAKEITVNFNRKGAGSKTAGFKSQSKTVEDAAKAFGVTSQILGEGRIFFNATVQAIATTFKNFQNADGSLNKSYIAKWAAKYALPPFMFGMLLPAINKALAAALGGDGDDDPYANLPEWTRRKNLCIYIGNNNFITIPVGQELAAFLTLGDIMAGNTYAPDLKPVDRGFDDEMLGVMNTFSPVDISTKITKGGLMEDPISEVTGRTFSVLAPLVAVEQNLGWTGRPIYREDVYPADKYNPEYQMVYQSTNPVMVGASKLANDLSGGDDVVRGKIQVNPAIVQYLWEQYTGGPGKVFSNTISIGKDAKDILTGNENDFNIRKVEGLKAFVQQGDDRTAYYRVQAKYRKYLDDAKKMKDAVNGYQQSAATDPMALPKLEKLSASKDYVRMQMVLDAEKSLSKINKAANKAEGKERKELRKMYNELVKQVVDLLDDVGK